MGIGEGAIWTSFDLETVSGPEDLDARLDALLEVRNAEVHGAVETLAAWLGIEPWALNRLAGVPIADDVASARLALLRASLAEVERRAERLRRGDDSRSLRQALAVCAALQWEVLGDVDSSAAAFACRDRPRFDGVLLAAAVREAVPRGRAAVLLRVRALAVAGATEDVAAAIAC